MLTPHSDGRASLPQALLQRWCLWQCPVFYNDLFYYLIQAEQESVSLEHVHLTLKGAYAELNLPLV